MKRRNEELGGDPKRQKPDYEHDEIQIDEQGSKLPPEQVDQSSVSSDSQQPIRTGDAEEVDKSYESDESYDEDSECYDEYIGYHIVPVEEFKATAAHDPSLIAAYIINSTQMQELANSIVAALTIND